MSLYYLDEKIFKIFVQKIIGNFLKDNGFERDSRSHEDLICFYKLNNNIEFNIDFQKKSFCNCFDFYYNTSGISDSEAPQIYKIEKEVYSDEQLQEVLLEIKGDIEEILLPWFQTVKKIEIEFKQTLLDCVSDRLNLMGFNFRADLFKREIVYSFSRSKKDTDIVISFPFVRLTNKYYDVIRFEVLELFNGIHCRLLFYPEGLKTKNTFISFLAKDIGNLKFENKSEYTKIITKIIDRLEKHADKWFDENRPSKEPEIENLGLFPKLEDLSKGKRKEYEELLKTLPPLK